MLKLKSGLVSSFDVAGAEELRHSEVDTSTAVYLALFYSLYFDSLPALLDFSSLDSLFLFFYTGPSVSC